MAHPSDILAFWYDPQHKAKLFKSDDAFDAQIRKNFEATAIDLAAGKLTLKCWFMFSLFMTVG